MANPAAVPLDFRVLGPVELWSAAERVNLGPAESPKVRCILAALLLKPGAALSIDALQERVWGERLVGPAVRYKYVGWLRAALAPHGVALLQDDHGYRLRLDAELVDLHRFRRLLGRANAAIRVDQASSAATAAGAALALWRGPALAGLPGDWAQLCREQLARERLDAATLRLRVEMTMGRDADLLDELDEWEAEYPTDETIIGLHVLALYRAGHADMASTCFSRARNRLRSSLDSAAGSALQELMRRIGDRDPTLRTAPLLERYRPSVHVPRPTPRPDPPPRAIVVESGGAIPRQLPPVTRQFVGRAKEVAELTDLLSQPGPGGPIVTISGGAGVGKTTLAGHWAHQVAGEFPDGQLYVDLRGFDPSGDPIAPGDALRAFLEALGADPKRMPGTLDTLAAQYRSLLARRRMLILLDNARDSTQARPLLPGSPSCLTVVTSRSTLAGLVAAEGAHPMILSLLATDAARALLGARLGTSRLEEEPDACQDLIEICAGLPLALSVVAARATIQRHLPLNALVRQLRTAGGRLDGLESSDGAVSVRAVFSWSNHGLSEPAARMFRLLCLPPGPDIGLHAVARLVGGTVAATGPLLDEVCAAHLITEPVPRRFAIHDLLREYGRELAWVDDCRPEAAAAMERLFDYYLHTAHAAALLVNVARTPLDLPAPGSGVQAERLDDRTGALAWFEAERQVLRAAIAFAARHGHDQAAWKLAWCVADFYNQRGYWHDWVDTQELALASARRLADQTALARCHQYLGYAHLRIHSGKDPDGHLTRALRLFRSLRDDAGLAGTHAMLAIGAEQRANYRVGLCHARRAVELRRRIDQPAALANSLNMLGWFHALLGEHDLAIGHCEEALRLHRQLGNTNGEAATWDSIGYAYHGGGRHHDAVVCFERAAQLSERLGDRYQLARILVHLADAMEALGAGAQEVLKQALSILVELDHPEAITIENRICISRH